MVRRLFVYGSLKRGGRHHAELAGARFIGVVETAPRYGLTRVGDYQGLVAGSEALAGELFEATDELLVALDAFEGPEYERVVVELKARAPANTAQAPGAGAGASTDFVPEKAARFALAYGVRTR